MSIPKKLDVINREDHVERFLHAAGVEDTFEIRNKVNELIDYLQAKEEASIIPVGCFCTKKHSTGEASKGECKQHSCEYYKCRCILDPKTGYCISKSWHVCNHCKPPEHEEDFDRLAEGLRNHVIDDVRFSGLFEYVKDYIRDNFEPKRKKHE